MNTRIIGIDPGTTQSAYVHMDGMDLINFGKIPNGEMSAMLKRMRQLSQVSTYIEAVASYGCPVGAEVFSTCFWIGRFYELSACPRLVFRRDVKQHICHNGSAKDPHVRQALIDLYGGKDKAIGKKAKPGPLHGVTADVWQALALGVTATGNANVGFRLEDAA